jgi:hypothetical protein
LAGDKMVKRYEFIIRMLYLIGKELEKLPDEDTLDEMMDKAKELTKDIFK